MWAEDRGVNSFARNWQVVTAYVRAAEGAKIKKGRPDVSLVTRRTDRCEGMGDTWGGGGFLDQTRTFGMRC